MENIDLLLSSFYGFSMIFAPVVAFCISFYVLPITVKIAIKKNLVDKPSVRTSHARNTPNLGGLSIFIGFIASVLIFVAPSNFREIQYILFGTIFTFALGFYDDILTNSAREKAVNELIVFVIVILFGNFRISSLHGLFGVEELPYWISFVLTVLVMFTIINCINLIDGIDGLASGVSFVISLFFGIYFFLIGEQAFYVICFSLCAAIIPFFVYNVWGTRYKLFMGDTGALLLGFLIAAMVVKFHQVNVVPRPNFYIEFPSAICLGVLMFPIFDAVRVAVIRIMHKKHPFKADKNHLHHKLLELGFSHKQASFSLIALTILLTVVSVLMHKYGTYRIVFMDLFIISAVYLLVFRALKMHKTEPKTKKR